ncbi:MAG: nitroreductase family protein, partial [Chloroflexi bacterium]|nr:nitroreductase family protein [Chloroflexota bacterium]
LSDRYIAQDLSASTQNILLAAHDMGLGAVWMGIFPVDERAQELTKVINIPQPYFPFSLIAVGHAAEAKGLRYNYTPNRVFWEKI